MSGVCFTSCNNDYLDKASVLARTFKAHHPDWKFVILLSDRGEKTALKAALPPEVDEIVYWDELAIPSPLAWSFCHDPEELCTAVKPFYADELLKAGVQRILFLDPDVAVLRRLTEIEHHLETESFLLTPHTWAPADHVRHIEMHEISSLAHGVFNLGFFALRNDANARSLIEFWRDRLRSYCYRDHARGLFTDQKWANFFPIFFDGVKILKERTLNVSSWNLANVDLEGSGPYLYASGEPVGFVHFSGISSDVFQRAAGEVGRLSNTVLELVDWYKAEVVKEQNPTRPRSSALLTYASGRRIEKGHRIVFRSNQTYVGSFADP